MGRFKNAPAKLAKEAQFSYTSGGEFRLRRLVNQLPSDIQFFVGDEYIGPYFLLKGVYYTGDKVDQTTNHVLAPYSIHPDVLKYQARNEKYNDRLITPKNYTPIIKPNTKQIQRVFVHDVQLGSVTEIEPRKAKYYKKSSEKPLRSRYKVYSLKWQIVGADALLENTKTMQSMYLPDEILQYLDPGAFVGSSPAPSSTSTPTSTQSSTSSPAPAPASSGVFAGSSGGGSTGGGGGGGY